MPRCAALPCPGVQRSLAQEVREERLADSTPGHFGSQPAPLPTMVHSVMSSTLAESHSGNGGAVHSTV
ncbi:hypothetical protein U0070_005362 [Myodes glareolus]|uniref:Uncharacterized protein n=1 Tax=Myodes glareolus TaxID=447135 RepID=A0AAW0HXF3_MYOGA